MAVVGEPNAAVFGDGMEVPADNLKLADTSGSFRRACRVLGGTPIPLFQPVLIQALDCLSGMAPMASLNNISIFMLFFVALFLDTEILANYIVFDLINKNNCVDILSLVSKFKKREEFLFRAVINYFISELKLEPEYIYLSMARSPRQLRWEISKLHIKENVPTWAPGFRSACPICKIIICDNEHLSMTKKAVFTPCCKKILHVHCYKKLMALLWGRCPYCRCSYASGVLLPTTNSLNKSQSAIVHPIPR